MSDIPAPEFNDPKQVAAYNARVMAAMQAEEEEFWANYPEKTDLPTWTDEEMEAHPLYMTHTPTDEEMRTNPNLLALESIIEETPPKERCENFKERGNEQMKGGLLDGAVNAYTNALAVHSGDSKLDATVHSNRAQAYLKQGKYIQCISDAQQALSLDPTQIKAAYRGAVGCLKLQLYARAAKFARCGLKIDPDSKDLSNVMGEAIEELKKARTQREQQKLEEHGETAEVDSALKTDWQKAVREDIKLKEIAKDMFPNKGCVPWDTKKEFVYNNFQAYLECYADSSNDRVVMLRLNTLNVKLGKILRGRRLVGMAVFHFIPKTDGMTIKRFEEENQIELFQDN
ncbi:Tetratricopeptide repeat protein 4 [Perkinsus chesapeaki]|uniref:Tetratricopeptide repeat protein 4 n=1 Tax=Perkinsus chesapeaki TaxID=330153 RepID=A0A7J6N2N3_PERCH|nr:Tetratricopeptide repeat protein 4 [Perkinsus chesapeaki]